MASKPKHKMPICDRAKQFMPFAALKGLPEALTAREKIHVPRMELSPEMAEQLDRNMRLLSKGQMTTITYFHQNEYLQITGRIAHIDPACRIIQIVNTKISFDDILDIDSDS